MSSVVDAVCGRAAKKTRGQKSWHFRATTSLILCFLVTFTRAAGAVVEPGEMTMPGRSVVDVMVLFTTSAVEKCGRAAVHEKIVLAFAYLNEACNRSGVHARFRLVHHAETTWHIESGTAAGELAWLRTDRTVAKLRDQVGADLVSLLAVKLQPYGGMAEHSGVFSVFNGTPKLFAHEIGHNLGCWHERANAGAYASRDDCNFGYCFTPPDTTVLYGDIMSWAGSDIQQFSNPNRYFLGTATGVASGHLTAVRQPDAADSAQTLNAAIPGAAQARVAHETKLVSPSLAEDGRWFQFQITGPDANGCTVEFTSDFVTWRPLNSCSVSAEIVQVEDHTGEETWRFYKVTRDGRNVGLPVGFIKKSVPVGLCMIGNQLETPDNTVGSILPSLPEGTQLYKWEEGRQKWVCNTLTFGAWSEPAMTLHPGEGVIIRNTSGLPFSVNFVGEVNQALFNGAPLQHSIRTSALPQAGGLSSVLGYVPLDAGAQVFRMTGTDGTYSTYTWEGESWHPAEPLIQIGEAFWCRNPVNAAPWRRVLWDLP